MARKYGLGLVTIEMGDIAGDGSMGTSLTAVGDTVQGTAQLTQEDGTNTDFNIEEEDDPILTLQTVKGKITLAWSCYNVSSDTLVKFFGGTVVVGPPEKWEAPASIPELEQSIKLTDKRGNIIEIVRAKVNAKFNWSFTKDKLAQIDLTASILTPTAADTPPYTITYPVASS